MHVAACWRVNYASAQLLINPSVLNADNSLDDKLSVITIFAPKQGQTR